MSSTTPIAAWEDEDYPLEAGEEICHKIMEDIRKRLFLGVVNLNADGTKAQTPTEDPTDGYYGKNGDFRTGNGLNNFGEGGSSTLNRGPGYLDVWFEDSWGPYTVVGATKDYGGSGKDEIWFEDEIDGDETTEYNMIEDCPLEITGIDNDTTEANGYWRIKSQRKLNVSGTNYILLTLEDFHGDNDLVLLNDRGSPDSIYEKGGAAACDFGGDWYMLCPRVTIDGAVQFTSEAVLEHMYSGNTRGNNELRPPDGGKYSRDWNLWWIRTPNPNLYHHYDRNAHRWLCQNNIADSVEYYSVIPSWKFLPIQTDPKEQVAPNWYKDTDRLEWNIAGNKVEIQAEQLTDHAKSGAITECTAQIDDGFHVKVNSIQYHTVKWMPDKGQGGFFNSIPEPTIPNDDLNKQEEYWPEEKFDTTCIWTWIEYMARKGGWCAPVNDAYKKNWLECNRYEYIDPTNLITDTYEDLYWSGSAWNLAGYNPEQDSHQKEYAYLYDELWGENGSAIEKLLSDTGNYDWFFDTTNPHMSGHVEAKVMSSNDSGNIGNLLLAWGKILLSQEYNHDSPPTQGSEAAANFDYPRAEGTWRKVPRYSFGYADQNDGASMRAKELGTPTGDDWSSIADDTFHLPWYGIYENDAPDGEEFGGSELDDRHAPVHTHDSIDYWEKVYLILNDVMVILNEMNYRFEQDAIIKYYTGSFSGITLSAKYDTIQECWEAWIAKAEDNYDPDIENDPQWIERSSPTQSGIGAHMVFWHIIADDKWQTIGSQNLNVMGIRIENLINPTGKTIPFMRVKFTSGNAYGSQQYDDSPAGGYHDAKVRLPNGIEFILEQPTPPNYDTVFVYKYIKLYDLIEENEFFYGKIFCLNAFSNIPVEWPLSGNEYYDNRALMNVVWFVIPVDLQEELLMEHIWDLYEDRIWERDDTYAKLKLEDPTTDEDPPIHEPIRLFLIPTIYDANLPHSQEDLPSTAYQKEDYIAKFRIKMNAILMEDLEGNSVEYRFEGTGGSGAIIASDFNSDWQSSREYDFVINMAIGSDAGDIEDLAEALSRGLSNWQFRVTARDRADLAGEGQSVNETESSEYVTVVAKENTIVPPIGMWRTEPFISGDDVHSEETQIIGPEGTTSKEYDAETVPDDEWESSWQDDDPEFVHINGVASLPQYYHCRARALPSGALSVYSASILLTP